MYSIKKLTLPKTGIGMETYLGKVKVNTDSSLLVSFLS